MPDVHWAKASTGQWHAFETMDLFLAKGSGVYVIWYDAQKPGVVCVGHGPLAARLAERRKDRGILMYRQLGMLKVTWTELPQHFQQGVARYLTETMRPPFGDMLLLLPPIAVEIPDVIKQFAHV